MLHNTPSRQRSSRSAWSNTAFLACVALAMIAGSQPVGAQSLSPELAALDAQLPGKLVNDPSRIDWDSYGPEFYAESIVDEAIPGGGAARRFHVNAASEFIYTAGTNIPLIRDVDRGDVITIGFWARTVSASTPDGKGVLRVRFQQDAPPYPGFGEETVEIGTEWAWYEVSATVEQKLRRRDGIVALQFGRTRQVLEIGQAIVVSGAEAIIGETLPTAKPAPAPPEPLLPPPLAGQGALLNDPAARRWTIESTGGSSALRDDPTIWLGKATRLATEAGANAGNRVTARIPLEKPFAEGERLLIAFAAKTVSADTASGRAMVAMRVEQVGQDDARFAENRMEVGPNWQLIRIATRAPGAFSAGTAQLVVELEGPAQSVDIGPVYVLKTD